MKELGCRLLSIVGFVFFVSIVQLKKIWSNFDLNVDLFGVVNRSCEDIFGVWTVEELDVG